MTRRVAIIGGGITGLSAAYDLCTRDDAPEVVVYEATDRVGGKLHTSPFAGRLVDEGADAFLARVPWAVDLCRELGLDSTLVSPATGVAYVWYDGRLNRIPAGTVLGVPTDDATPRTPAERPLRPDEDVALGALIRAQLGDEVADRFVGPLVGSINAGDIDRLSARATAPQLADAATRDADIVAGLRVASTPAPGPVFLSPSDGMGALVDALVDALHAHGATIKTGTPITDPHDVDAETRIVALPARPAAELLAVAAPETAQLLLTIPYASVAIVTLAYPAAAALRELDGSGFLVPATEGLLMTACSWASSKWAHLASDDTVIVRASAGRYGDDRASVLDDDALVTQIVDALALTSGFAGEPQDVRVTRWPESFPQYVPGHLDHVTRVERRLADELTGTHLAGAALRGLGVPACIRQGREAAAAVLADAPRR